MLGVLLSASQIKDVHILDKKCTCQAKTHMHARMDISIHGKEPLGMELKQTRPGDYRSGALEATPVTDEWPSRPEEDETAVRTTKGGRFALLVYYQWYGRKNGEEYGCH